MIMKKTIAVLAVSSMIACTDQQDLQNPENPPVEQSNTAQNVAVLAGLGVLLSILLVKSLIEGLEKEF